jgi:hypothetical protein
MLVASTSMLRSGRGLGSHL